MRKSLDRATTKLTVFKGENLNRVAFPMGGIGAGTICLEGTGTLSHFSLRHQPDVYNEPQIFGALFVKGAKTARVLEGPVPLWKAFGTQGRGSAGMSGPGNGLMSYNYGLPRMADVSFQARFPFATVALADPTMPISVDLIGWSPFTPGAADDSSLPVAALEYELLNNTDKKVEAVFSFHAPNFLQIDDKARVDTMPGGFVLSQAAVADRPEAESAFAAFTDDPHVTIDAAWFRGGWFDAITVTWGHVNSGMVISQPPHAEGQPGRGGSFYIPFELDSHARKTIRVLFAWYTPRTAIRAGKHADASGEKTSCCGESCCGDKPATPATHVPWYAGRFASLAEVAAYWRANYDRLRAASLSFSNCFYDTTLPVEAIEAAAANIAILKTPTCLRQIDGRLWSWEGCCGDHGCCWGSCTHVWNYAQALPHLFPELERTLRETEFLVCQDERGHQTFRATIPIGPVLHDFHAAADGQLGGLIKLHREWRICGDTNWLRRLWPAARASIDYCISTWDPDRVGMVVEPHHNTYDIEFWGANGMITSFYIGALAAVVAMGAALGDDVSEYTALLARGREAMRTTLWNGSWFIQKTEWQGMRAGSPIDNPAIINSSSYTPEAIAILRREGPKYQYGNGVLSDGIIGDWMARCAGLGPVVDEDKVASHLAEVFRHNFRVSATDHANLQRPGFMFPQESGLLLCSWPKGDKPTLPFVYSDEVWTGIEYHVAAHLIMTGQVEEGLRIVRAVRERYSGRWRNPFNEYECGHWYARAMSSYSLLQALSGARYDAVEQVLYLQPAISGDFRAFLCTAGGYGTVGVCGGKPFLEVVSGTIPVREIKFQAPKR